MTNNELDGLFATARNTPAETSVKEVTAWVGTAAVATAGLGVLAKFKLIFIKKIIIMITGSIITGGIVASVVILNSGNPKPSETLNAPVAIKTELSKDDSINSEKREEVFVFDSSDEKTTLALVPNESLPIMPLRSLEGFLNIQPVQPVASSVTPVGNKRSPAKDFQTIHISGIYDVVIKQGSAPKLELKKDGTFTEITDCKVEEGVLFTDASEQVNNLIIDGGELVLYVTVTNSIKEINHDGVGNLSSEGILKVPAMRLSLSGVGDVEMDLECTDLKVEFSGVGDVKLIGSSNTGEIEYNGVGDFKGYDFIFDVLQVSHNGVGDVLVYATRSVKIDANGVGDVCYKGDPSEKEIENNGIGKVKKK